MAFLQNTQPSIMSHGVASSMPNILENDSSSAVANRQQRYFCVVLTNNPRMILSARRMLQQVNDNAPNEQLQEDRDVRVHATAQCSSQPARLTEQQVPWSPQDLPTNITVSNARAYERKVENDFQAQVQPMLQDYLDKTQRASPINSVFDMSNYVDS